MSEALGTFFIKLDEKGRIILPAKARAQLATGTYLTRGQDQCVFLFSQEQFATYRKRNSEQAPPGMPAMAFDRIFFSSVVTQDLDKQGRITVPPVLRQYAGLDRDLAVVGLEERMEVWDAARWQAYLDTYLEQFSQLQEGLR